MVKAGLCKTVGLTHDEGVADHVGGVVDGVPPQGGQVHAVHQWAAQQQNNASTFQQKNQSASRPNCLRRKFAPPDKLLFSSSFKMIQFLHLS